MTSIYRQKAAVAAAEIFELCAYRLRVMAFASDLPQAQWAALRYFAQCNPRAADVTSYAKLHQLSGGTASRTLAHLVRKGLLTSVRTQEDRRRASLRVSPKGRAVLDRDPLHALVMALQELDPASLRIFVEALDKVSNAVSSRQDEPESG